MLASGEELAEIKQLAVDIIELTEDRDLSQAQRAWAVAIALKTASLDADENPSKLLRRAIAR